jgi:hypothetical protein
MIDRLITLQGGPKHTEGCPHKEFTNQAVPIIPRIRIGYYSIWTTSNRSSSLTRVPQVASMEAHLKISSTKFSTGSFRY